MSVPDEVIPETYCGISLYKHVYIFFLIDSDIAPWADLSPPLYTQGDWIVPEKVKVYRPLMERQKCGKTYFKIE